MCFAPRRCALFRHLNFKKCSETASFCNFWLRHVLRAATFQHLNVLRATMPCAFQHLIFQNGNGVFCTVWLGHVLRATIACTVSTAQLPNGLRHWGVFGILTWKLASCHSCVQFFIAPAALASLLFQPSEATTHWKNTVWRDFSTFSRPCIFFRLMLSLLWSSLFCLSLLCLFPPLLFHLSIVSEVWRLNFLRV